MLTLKITTAPNQAKKRRSWLEAELDKYQAGFWPDTATGKDLDHLCSLLGLVRQSSTPAGHPETDADLRARYASYYLGDLGDIL